MQRVQLLPNQMKVNKSHWHESLHYLVSRPTLFSSTLQMLNIWLTITGLTLKYKVPQAPSSRVRKHLTYCKCSWATTCGAAPALRPTWSALLQGKSAAVKNITKRNCVLSAKIHMGASYKSRHMQLLLLVEHVQHFNVVELFLSNFFTTTGVKLWLLLL